MASVVTSGMATLAELQTVYGIRDLYDLIEIATVRQENERLAYEGAKTKAT